MRSYRREWLRADLLAVGAHPNAEKLPGIVVYRWEAPLFFANVRRAARPPAGPHAALRPDGDPPP